MPKKTEACGRCSMSVVVDAVEDGESGKQQDPFGEERIEVDMETFERVSPGAWTSRVSRRIDDAVNRLIWR